MILPDCMAPDGAPPCEAYRLLRQSHAELLDLLREMFDTSGSHPMDLLARVASAIARAEQDARDV